MISVGAVWLNWALPPTPRSSTATWPLDPSKEEKQGWRHIRIKQMGKNASGQTHYLSLSGLELYGTVSGVCEDQLGKDDCGSHACCTYILTTPLISLD